MGDEQIKAAGLYYYGEESALSFQSFPVQGKTTTFSADNFVTDSAASATAMATGSKVNNGVVSQRYPGNGEDLKTILEIADSYGMGTGVVTTTVLSHATPAAFVGHAPHRGNFEEIVDSYLTGHRPDVLLGGGGVSYGLEASDFTDNNYRILSSASDLSGGYYTVPTAGLFGNGHMPYESDGLGGLPHLSDMADYALDALDDHYEGFFLLVEGGRIDHACHDNDLPRALAELLEFSNTINKVLDWARERNDVLIIVTADHETGGLSIVNDKGIGNYPDVNWSTDKHTGVPVSYFIWGEDSGKFTGISDNTDYFEILKNLIAD